MSFNSQGWMPYLATYVSFLVIIQIKGIVEPPGRDWLLLPQVLIPGGLLLYYLVRHAYPELQGIRFSLLGPLADIAVGLLVGILWMAPYVLGWFSHPPADEGFDSAALAGDRFSGMFLTLRFVGFVLVTPFVEELFVRSALLRYVAGMRTGTDFRRVPLARFEWAGFIATVLYFTFSHASWEWPVAFVIGVVLNLWLYHRGSLGSTIRAHAVANGTIYLAVVFPGVVEFGKDLDLRYFL